MGPAAALVTIVFLTGCQTVNDRAKLIGKAPDNAVALRALQTRRFDTTDEKALLSTAAQTLQDLGFTISESAADVGVIVASKQRNAEESGQVAAQVGLTVLFALMGTTHNPTWDQEQTIQVTFAAIPIGNARQTEVRTTFDRILTNNHGHKWRAELLMEPEIYQQFYERLSTSAFLEAHKI